MLTRAFRNSCHGNKEQGASRSDSMVQLGPVNVTNSLQRFFHEMLWGLHVYWTSTGASTKSCTSFLGWYIFGTGPRSLHMILVKRNTYNIVQLGTKRKFCHDAPVVQAQDK
jgi:hypothetical protein